ncbi:hypothetical protein [Photobacterium sanguinicancri]|uniref:Serine protease n=1 Tax=Photobacterium sanguinicancri TaxID=875932 RepID=A0ABX4FTT4_9GAMM|nr:hypothetical protein [Photobacterium sanguinicancri]OZS42197.1 hypothetical protein ASV53_19760 [Photobacterium sanguinicancri]
MKILKNNIKSNFVTLKSNGVHIGCGFLFKSNDDTYCVTAGHVVYGRKYDNERIVEILDNRGVNIERFELISFIDFAKKYDLALFKLYSKVDKLKPVILCNSITNNKLLSISYMKPTSLTDSFFLDAVKFNDDLDDNQFRYSAGQSAFNNFKDDTYGAEAMEGISGSPMLLCSWDGAIVLHGITSRIPNSGMFGFIETRDLTVLNEVVDSIDFKSSEDFDSNHRLIRFNRKLIDDERFNNWVDTWKNLPGNESFYGNLESKLETIHGDSYTSELPKELEKIMIGDECFKNVIEKNSTLYDSYDDVIETAERDKMEKYVSSKHEALEHYNKVYEEHLDVINEDLGDFDLSRTDRKKIAQYNVATWMAVCNLRFSKK